MKKSAYIIFIFLILLSFCSCKIESQVDYEIIAPNTVEMGDTNLSDFKLKTSNGDIISIDESMLSDSILAFYKEGEQTIKINYKGKEKEFTINVLRRHFENIKFDELVVNYTGENVEVSVSGDIPASANIWYPYGNSFANPGVYSITAVLSAPYYETITMQTTLTIKETDL